MISPNLRATHFARFVRLVGFGGLCVRGREVGVGDVKALNEKVEELQGGAEGPVGCQEGLHEDGRGVHVVGQPFHQLQQRGSLNMYI